MKWQFTNTGERFLRLQTKILRCLGQLWLLKHYRRKLLVFPLSLVAVSILFSWTVQSNSCALYAFFAIILFDVITLFGDLLNQLWITGGKPSTSFSFGYVRVEVLIHFSVLCLGLLLNCWAVKKSLELVVFGGGDVEGEIHTGRFIPGAIVGGVFHFFLSFNNSPFTKVYKVSAVTTTLQKYFQGISASFGFSLSSTSSFALSPFAIFGGFAISTVLILAFALQTGPLWFDFVGGLLIIIAVFDALCPLAIYTAQVLLQTVPAHVVTQLEKSLREALTIDGVLEFRNELFWTLTYGQICGTLHVRVRSSANEQIVLSKVYDKLQPLAPHLTVQVTKDDFGRPFGNLHILRDLDSSLTHITTVGHHNHHLLSSSELSPIPSSLSHNNHLITTTGRNHGHEIGISSTPRFSSSDSEIHLPSRSFGATELSINDFESTLILPNNNDSRNHLKVPMQNSNNFSQTTALNNSPFVISGGAVGANNANQNQLISSAANYFPE